MNKDEIEKAIYPKGKGWGFNFLKWFIRIKHKDSIVLFSERYGYNLSKVIFNYRITIRKIEK